MSDAIPAVATETAPAIQSPIEIPAELQPALFHLKHFALDLNTGDDANFAQALLLARVAERNLYVTIKPLSSSRVLGRKVHSPVDGGELRVIDADIVTSKLAKLFTSAAQLMDGHIILLNPSTDALPGAFLDRCGVSANVDMTRAQFFSRINALKPVIDSVSLDKIQEIIGQVYKASIESMAPRLVALRRATDPRTGEFAFIHGENAEQAKESVADGLSPRISFDLMLLATANAVIDGRTEITNDDLARVFVPCTVHRLALSPKAKSNGFNAREFLKRTAEGVMKATTEQLNAVSSEAKKAHAHGDDCGCVHDHKH